MFSYPVGGLFCRSAKNAITAVIIKRFEKFEGDVIENQILYVPDASIFPILYSIWKIESISIHCCESQKRDKM